MQGVLSKAEKRFQEILENSSNFCAQINRKTPISATIFLISVEIQTNIKTKQNLQTHPKILVKMS